MQLANAILIITITNITIIILIIIITIIIIIMFHPVLAGILMRCATAVSSLSSCRQPTR